VADTKLLSGVASEFGERIDLCIDHHLSNKEYAQRLLLKSDSASCAEVIYEVMKALGVDITKEIATALYTGICTDTGCFMYGNCSADTHLTAAQLIKCGAEKDYVNRKFFGTKSKGRLFLEKKVLENLETHFDGLCAMTVLDYDTINSPESDYSELDGVAAIPRSIEGGIVGITVKEKERGNFKVSVRTYEPIDASAICARLSGGGHARAAGCEFKAQVDSVKKEILESVQTELSEQGLI
jgi:phosphoesterase RecJ-like protein